MLYAELKQVNNTNNTIIQIKTWKIKKTYFYR